MLRESFIGSEFSPWLRERFDAIEISTRGDREVVFNEQLTATESELADALGVRQTPAIMFLDATNRVVVRSDGYRTPRDFKRILDYVDSKSYLRTDLASFIRARDDGPPYALRDHAAFAPLTDLAGVNKPLMVILEDSWCDGCDLMHDTLLRNDVVNDLMAKMTVVRLDAASDEPMVAPDGTATTPREWAATLGLAARPAIVIHADGEERVRIKGVLRRFHFQTALRYVADGHYRDYPTVRDFGRAWQEKLIAEGVVIDVGVQ